MQILSQTLLLGNGLVELGPLNFELLDLLLQPLDLLGTEGELAGVRLRWTRVRGVSIGARRSIRIDQSSLFKINIIVGKQLSGSSQLPA